MSDLNPHQHQQQQYDGTYAGLDYANNRMSSSTMMPPPPRSDPASTASVALPLPLPPPPALPFYPSLPLSLPPIVARSLEPTAAAAAALPYAAPLYLRVPTDAPALRLRYILINHITAALHGPDPIKTKHQLWQCHNRDLRDPLFETGRQDYVLTLTTTYRPVGRSAVSRYMVSVDVIEHDEMKLSIGGCVVTRNEDGLPGWEDIKATLRFLKRICGAEREEAALA